MIVFSTRQAFQDYRRIYNYTFQKVPLYHVYFLTTILSAFLDSPNKL